MSQVIRKFEDGGTTPKEPLLLERENVGKYNADELIKNATLGADAWLQSKGIKGAQAQGFKQNLPRLLDAMKAGKVKVLADGRIDTGDTGLSSSGEYDKKKFLGIKTGGYKDTENNSLNDVGAYMNSLLADTPTYEAPKPEELKPYDFNVRDYLKNKHFGGKNFTAGDWEIFDDVGAKTGKRGTTNRLGHIASGYEEEANRLLNDEAYRGKSKWKDDQEYQNTAKSLQDYANELRANGYTDADRRLGFTAGQGRLDDLLSEGGTQEQEGTKPDLTGDYKSHLRQKAIQEGLLGEEAINAYIDKAMMTQADTEATQIKETGQLKQRKATEAYFDEYQKNNPFKSSISGDYSAYNPNYNFKGVDDYMAADDNNYFQNVLSRNQFTPDKGQHIVNNLDYLYKRNAESLVDVGEGYKAIPTTYDYNKYSTIAYNPASKQYKEVSMLVNDTLKKFVYDNYENSKAGKPTISITSRRGRGAGTKFQEGGVIDYDLIKKRIVEDKATKSTETAAAAQKAQDTNRTPEQIKAGAKKIGSPDQDWSTEDKIRLGTAAADVTSILTAFIPGYGTAASAVLGVGSTVGGLTADIMDDSVSGWQATGNAAYGLGMDVIGLIPGLGASGKAGKIVKALTKVAPKVLMAWGAYENTIPAADALNKLMHDSSNMTVDDWKNLSAGLTTLAGGTRMVAGNRALNRYSTKTTSKMVRTKSGKMVKLTPEQYDQLSNASGIESQNTVLGSIAKGEELGQAFIPRKLMSRHPTLGSKPQTKTVTERNFDNNSNEIVSKDEAWFRKASDVGSSINKGEKKVGDAISNAKFFPNWASGFATAKNPHYKAPATPDVPKPTPTASGQHMLPTEVSKTQTASSPIITPPPGQYRSVPTDKTDHNALSARRQGFKPNYERVSGESVQTPSKPDRKTYVATRFEEPINRQPIVNPPAVIPKTQLAPLEKFLPQRPGQALTTSVSAQIEKVSKRMAAQIVKKATKPGKATKDVVASLVPKKPRGHDVRAKELQATFDEPVQVTQVTKPKVADEPYVSKTKPKRKIKAKNKSNKGYVNKKAEGGVIELFKGGGISGVKPVQGNWYQHVQSKYRDDLATSLDSGKITYQDINMMGDRHSKLYNNWKSKGDAYEGSDVKQYQNDVINSFGYVNNKGINNAFKIARYQLPKGAYTGDNPSKQYTADGRFSGITDDRRILGREGDYTPEQFTDTQNFWKGKGYNINLNPNNKYYQLNPLDNTTGNAVAGNTVANGVGAVKNSTPGNSYISAGDRPVKTKSKFNIVPEDVMALGRMASGLITNNRAAARYKEGLKPNLIDTFENSVPVQGNFHAKNAAYSQAANLESAAARPFTSDASLQLAGQLDATNKAGQMRTQGDMADADMFYRTRLLGQQERDAAKARRVEVGNRNMASMNQIGAAKAQIDSARMTANYSQVLAPYLAGVENQFRQNKAINRQIDIEAGGQKALSDYGTAMDNIKNTYSTWKQTNPTGTPETFAATAGKKSLLNANNTYQTSILNTKRAAASPWMITTNEKGGKLTKQDKEIIQRAKDFNKRLLMDSKQFHKDIMESKKEHNKLLIAMSGLTSELIKRGMS